MQVPCPISRENQTASVKKVCNRKWKNESYQKKRETRRDMPHTRPLRQYFVYFIEAKIRYGRSFKLPTYISTITIKSRRWNYEMKWNCEIPVVDDTVIDASFFLYLQLIFNQLLEM